MEDIKKSTDNTAEQTTPVAPAKVNDAPAAQAPNSGFRGQGQGYQGGGQSGQGDNRKRNFKGGRRGGPGGRGRGEGGLPEEFEQKMIDIARVTRVMAGGKRMRFRACVAIGNKKGRIAIGLAKGADVTGAVTKAVNKAKKNFIDVPIINETIPHEIYQKLGAAKILFKPAKKGRGIIAGGAVRILLELSGIKNVTSKILGTGNKVNNVKCAILALSSLKKVEYKPVKKENGATIKPKAEIQS